MLEPELRLRPAPALANQVEPLELAQRLAQLLFAAGDAREQREPEAPAEHRGGRQRARGAGAEAVDAGEDHLLDASRARRSSPRGRTARHRSSRCRAPASASDRTSSSRKNGLPSACPRSRGLELGRQRALPDQRVQQLALRVTGERLELELPRPVREPPRRELTQAPRRVVGIGPLRDHEQHRRVLGDREQLLGQLQRRRVGPVHVLERRRPPAPSQRGARTGRARPRTSGTAALPARARTAGRATPDPASARAAPPR